MPTDYQPVSCELHSEIELHAMHGNRVSIETHTSEAAVIGRIVDVSTHDKAEYVIIETGSQQQQEIRLDQILKMTPL